MGYFSVNSIFRSIKKCFVPVYKLLLINLTCTAPPHNHSLIFVRASLLAGSVALLTGCILPNTSQTGNTGDNQVNINLFVDGDLMEAWLKKKQGSPSPSPSVTPGPSTTPTPLPTVTPSPTTTPSINPTPGPTPTASVSGTPLPTPTPSVTPSTPGYVFTLSGSGQSGLVDGPGVSARFDCPYGVTVDLNGNIYVADTHNHAIRKITLSGLVSTLAGNGQKGFADGPGASARFEYPRGLTVDTFGNIYVADWGNHMIRKVTPTGHVSTIAGSQKGFLDGTVTSARFNSPADVTMDNTGTLYVADHDNDRIRQIMAGQVTTIAGSQTGFADGAGGSARFKDPHSVAVDSSGVMYVADKGNHRIRKLVKNSSQWHVSTLAGSGQPGAIDGSGTSARFKQPIGLTVNSSGQVVMADEDNHRIRLITASGEVSTVAGQAGRGFLDGVLSVAKFEHPADVAVTSDGHIVVLDRGNNRIRVIVP